MWKFIYIEKSWRDIDEGAIVPDKTASIYASRGHKAVIHKATCPEIGRREARQREAGRQCTL